MRNVKAFGWHHRCLKKDWFFFKCAWFLFVFVWDTRRDDAICCAIYNLESFLVVARHTFVLIFLREETAWLPKCIIPSIGTKYVSWSHGSYAMRNGLMSMVVGQTTSVHAYPQSGCCKKMVRWRLWINILNYKWDFQTLCATSQKTQSSNQCKMETENH